jgi:hypothetical protein
MAELKKTQLKELYLDLENYRTIHQKSESDAIKAMIAISPDRFWSLMESLLDDGYHPTDNIMLLRGSDVLIVKEGNRRVAALKIAHGLVSGVEVTDSIRARIADLSQEWKDDTANLPCLIYELSELDIVTKNIALIHAKGEKAGRDQWTAVAKARFNRDVKKQKEVGLDLLESYLNNGRNISPVQIERWSGDYHLTVLNEALPKIYSILGCSSIDELFKLYPNKNRTKLDKILFDIGNQTLGFKELRDKKNFFGLKYGLTDSTNSQPATPPSTTGISLPQSAPSGTQCASAQTGGPGLGLSDKPSPPSHAVQRPPNANPSNNPKAVYKLLKDFKPRGNGREKIAALLNEMRRLKIDLHPHSFCFLLRSLFEISAKVYSDQYKDSGCPAMTKPDGKDKQLAVGLKDIVNFMTSSSTDRNKQKSLHGAITEISKNDGILSVTSMNQLVHNPKFSIQVNDLCTLFGNVFPLLEELNR